MHSPCEGVESVAEMIARLVCDYEARQVAEPKKKSPKSAALPKKGRWQMADGRRKEI